MYTIKPLRMPQLPSVEKAVRRKTLTAKPGSQTDLAERNVTMANVIVRSAFNLNLSEMRLLSAALANTDATDARALTAESFWTVKLSAIDYAKTFKVSLDTAYEQMAKALDRLLRHLVVRPHPTQKGATLKHQWISRGVYEQGRGTVTLTWHEDIRPFVLGLRKEFTTYRLSQAAAFRSVYAWYLWNTLKSWQGIGRWSPSLEEFAVCMSAESYLGNFKEMRRRVLEPAVKELRDKNNMEIVWEQVTEGRKTVGLRFHFQHAKQGALDLADAPTGDLHTRF
jgi:plasmid replication initiation protein